MNEVRRTMSRARHFLNNMDDEHSYLDTCFAFIKEASKEEKELLYKESLKDGYALRHFSRRY